MPLKPSHKISPNRQLNSSRAGVFALLAAAIGIVVVLVSHASSAPTAFEAEAGSLSGEATIVTDSAASSGHGVKFSRASYVTVCGTHLCLNGTNFYMFAGSVYGGLDNPSQTIQEAQVGKLNTIRITDWLDTNSDPTTGPTDPVRWAKVDALLAAANNAHLKILLDLSTFRNLLKQHSINSYTYNWQPFLQFVTTRVNTVNGHVYANDPTIAMVTLAGEVDPPNGSPNPLGVTQQQVTDFYRRSLAQLAVLDTHHVRASGGFLQLDWNSGIDWHTIFADPNDQVCDIHDYSKDDQTITPSVASYCSGLGKPWLTEEFGFNQTDGDATRAAQVQSMYNLQTTNHAAGVGFWNLGLEVVGVNGKTSTFDINAQTPQTLSVVQRNAP
jgi:hypothetical protein